MSDAHLEPQFGSAASEREAAQLGMWIFLATEILLFSGLFTSYAAFRFAYPNEFREAARHMNVGLGTANTYLLITSSLLVALGVYFIRRDQAWRCAGCLSVAVLFGVVFLVIKGVEYTQHAHEGALPGPFYSLAELPQPGANIFFTLYFLLTGLHAIHMTVAVGVLSAVAFQAASGKYSRSYHTPVELGGMYWHLVDIIWIFLYPLLYLVTPT